MIALKHSNQQVRYKNGSEMRKNLLRFIPNMLSCTRILLSIYMVMIWDYRFNLFGLYILCGITDILDGYIARKFNVESKLGSILDSVGDLMFFSVITYWIVFHSNLSISTVEGILLLIILIVRIINIITTQIKFDLFGIMHTLSNKITGALYFLLVPILIMSSSLAEKVVTVLLFIALISAIEEWFIIIYSKSYQPDEKSIITALAYNKARVKNG